MTAGWRAANRATPGRTRAGGSADAARRRACHAGHAGKGRHVLRAGFTRRAAAGPGLEIAWSPLRSERLHRTPRLSVACDRSRDRCAGRARNSARREAAMAHAARRADCDRARLRSPSPRLAKRAAIGDALLLDFSRGLFRCERAGSGGAAVVDRPARMDARHVPHPRRDRRAARGVGDDHFWAALAADALFSESRGRAAESHRRPRRDL